MIVMQLSVMRTLLLILMTLALLKLAESVNGVIWNKKSENFVPIFGTPSFAEWKQEVFRKSREQETHNDFQGKTVRLTYYKINKHIERLANGTKVTGAIGEVWNTLADYLNFTLKPILSKENLLGINDANGIYRNGLLRVIQFNETDAIPRMVAHTSRLRAVQFIMPLWATNYRLYIRWEMQHQSWWILKLFSPDVWHAIVWMYFLLTVCSYVSRKAGIVLTHRKCRTDLNDQLFYNFGMIYCNQNYLPESFSVSSSIVELCLGIFSLLIRTAFSAFVFSYLSQVTISPPFDDLASLLDSTSYNILALSGSIQELMLQKKLQPIYERINEMNRYDVVVAARDLYAAGCSSDKQYAIFESEDIKETAGLSACRLNPVGEILFKLSVTSGVVRNFQYKRTIDIAIIKLHETGIIRLLRNRWIEPKNTKKEDGSGAKPINMPEVYVILCILGAGWLIACLIFILEKLTFRYYSCNR